MIYTRSQISLYYVLLKSKRMTNNFDDFVIVVRKDHQVRAKIYDMLDRYNRLPYKYQSEIGYDTLIQNVLPKELIISRGTTITDLDLELKMKNNSIKYLEIRIFWICKFI